MTMKAYLLDQLKNLTFDPTSVIAGPVEIIDIPGHNHEQNVWFTGVEGTRKATAFAVLDAAGRFIHVSNVFSPVIPNGGDISMHVDLAHIFPRWNGEGLPPVGINCEYQHKEGVWVPCEVIAHFHAGATMAAAVIAEVGHGNREVFQANFRHFRPLPTADEQAAKELYLTINRAEGADSWELCPDTRRQDYRKAIAAGYRKVSS